jgi:hypothetical protein
LFGKIFSSLEKEGKTKIAVFGSYARGEKKPENDIDILQNSPKRKVCLPLLGLSGNG